MWKSILLSLLLQGMVSAVQAEQESLSLTLASDTGSNETAKLQTGLPHRDCNNLGYEAALISPCGDEACYTLMAADQYYYGQNCLTSVTRWQTAPSGYDAGNR